MIRWGSAARALLLAPRQALVLSRRAFSDAAPDAAAAAAPEEAGEAASKSQRQKQAKADAKAKAADAKPAPPDFIDATLASFEQNGSSIQRTAEVLSLDPLKVAAYVKLGQIRQQRMKAGDSIDVTKSFVPPRNRSGYSQLKKSADKIYAFDDERASAPQSKTAKQPPPLFPDRALPPMADPPVSMQPLYASPNVSAAKPRRWKFVFADISQSSGSGSSAVVVRDKDGAFRVANEEERLSAIKRISNQVQPTAAERLGFKN